MRRGLRRPPGHWGPNRDSASPPGNASTHAVGDKAYGGYFRRLGPDFQFQPCNAKEPLVIFTSPQGRLALRSEPGGTTSGREPGTVSSGRNCHHTPKVVPGAARPGHAPHTTAVDCCGPGGRLTAAACAFPDGHAPAGATGADPFPSRSRQGCPGADRAHVRGPVCPANITTAACGMIRRQARSVAGPLALVLAWRRGISRPRPRTTRRA
jgi:hypothetical protein